MRHHLPAFAVAAIIVAVALWAVGLWYYMSMPVIVDGPKYSRGDEFFPVDYDVTVHLMFSSNVSTTVYLEPWASPYSTERIEVASNVTFLDTRFVPKELGVRTSVCSLLFIPATQPARMNISMAHEIPNNFYYIYIFLGMGFAGLGIADIAYKAWKRRLEAKIEEQVSKAVCARTHRYLV